MPETIFEPTARHALTGLAADRAKDVDAGVEDPRRTLEALADDGLLTLGLPNSTGSVAAQAAVIEQLAEGCLATAFCAWGHRMTLEYLAPAGGEHFEQLKRLDRIGSSAMAAAFKAHAGIEPLALKARRDGDAIVLDGRMPWASNLHDDTIVVLPAELEGEGPVILALPLDVKGVTLRSLRDLLALEATASGQIFFEQARYDVSVLLAEPFDALIERVRRPFLILQTAYCVGLTRTALGAADTQLEGLGAVFSDDAEALHETLESASARLARFADDDSTSARELIQLRLDAAVLARESVRIEAAVTGGRGFVASSPTGRRIREAAFLPVQSPTEGQLRWQLRQSA